MANLDVIQEEAKNIISRMSPEAEVEVKEDEGVFLVSIQSENDAPTLIGRHGDTIKALQKILEVILYTKLGESVNVVVNVNDYREKQRERLENIAAEHAERALEQNGPSYLRGFSSFERRIMHEFITNEYPELKSYSIGEGRDRRLVVNVKDEDDSEAEEESTDFSELQEQ
jgi:spoIIIJ-associated protein